MKKALITTLLLATSQLFAATKEFSDIPGYLLDEVLFASTFQKGTPPEIRDVQLHMGNGMKNNQLTFGDKHSSKGYLRTGLEHDRNRTQACTISFDIYGAAGDPGQVVWGLYSPGMAFDKGLRLVIGSRNTLLLECNQFTGTTLSGRRAKRNLGKISELTGKTITVVYDGGEDTVMAYVNGVPAGKAMRLTHGDNSKTNRYISSMSWGDNYCGWGRIKSATIDNVYFWGEALSEDEIKELIRFEMTPLYWGIAGGAAGLLLIIAALIIVKLKKKARPAA
ncbi:MAG: hypothetical protein IJ956_00710 [Akkermansia sp.]|nr:hypothetical protein [Akkermansia sp.]